MANHHSAYSVWAPRALSLLRIVAGFMMLQHGAQKLFGVLTPPPAPGAEAATQYPLLSLVGVAGALEFFGGLLLLLGLFTRPTAFILSGLMAAAYFMAHAPQGFWPILNMGESAALYSFVFLYLAGAGGGPWGVDRLLWRGGTSPAPRTGLDPAQG
ncbi:MAG: DoxX family protein [Pyrinomonadaceae bacterium]|nr:DoxX family protein [Pyrinomonadaceae bacterium]